MIDWSNYPHEAAEPELLIPTPKAKGKLKKAIRKANRRMIKKIKGKNK